MNGALNGATKLPLLALLALASACGQERSAAPIRDARPSRLERGDRLLIEGEGNVFAVGAPTTVYFDQILAADGKPVALAGRAVAANRVIADADAALERQLDGRHVQARSTITVEQTGAGATRRQASDARAPFELDLFPHNLRHLADGLAARVPAWPAWLLWAIALFGAAAIVAAPVPVVAGLVVVWERKVAAYMQSRLGPNRVGPNGWLQWLADGLKLLMKEDLVPAEADPLLFRAAPYLAFVGLFLTFIVMPFSHFLIVADLNIGLLFLLSVTSLIVVSIIMGGWSSNSKWSLLGGMRSAAQIISYELPASVALLTIATLTGSLSTQRIVEAQGGWPWQWYVFHDPFTFAAFFIWFIAALAEGNRTPFDLPEAESELVSGYNTEYSGFRFSLFPLVEWVNVFMIGALATTLFLGGWRLPLVSVAAVDGHWWLDVAGFGLFVAKDIAIIFVVIWIRWTLPRFRVDQLMSLCWKYCIPLSFAAFVGELAWTWLMPQLLQSLVSVAMFAVFGVGFGLWFAGRVRANARGYRDLVLNQALGRANR